jgi:hypothetical protein
MHHTIATGNVIAKEAAGDYARRTFDPRWHPVIDKALAYRHNEPVRPSWNSRSPLAEHCQLRPTLAAARAR